MIRLATSEEAYTVHQVMLQAFDEYRYTDVPSSALDEQVVDIEQSMKHGHEQAILYFDRARAMGSARWLTEGVVLYFSRLSVIPEARGRGIAKAMVHWLEHYAKQQGLSELRCRVRVAKPENIALYQKAGFGIELEEIVINGNGTPINTVVMSKKVQ